MSQRKPRPDFDYLSVLRRQRDQQIEDDARKVGAFDELLAALRGMLSIEDSVTQGQEGERRAEWVPKARAAIAKATQT